MSNSEKIKKNILGKIERGELYMRPRWQFVLKGILALVGIGIMALTVLYLMSFIFFALRQSGLFFIPVFGLYGVQTLLFAAPWFLILLALIFIVVLEILVRKYSFGYQKPLLYTMFGVIAFSLFGTYALAQSGLHEHLDRYAQRDMLPVVGPMYRNYGMGKLPNVHAGFISETTEDGYILENRRGERFLIHVTENTQMPYGREFEEMEHVIVFGDGDGDDDDVVAEGIRPFPEGMRPAWAEEEEEFKPPHSQVRGTMRHRKED